MPRFNKFFTLVSVFFVLSPLLPAISAQEDQNPAYDQARQDYRAYLGQLQQISQRYREVTGEMKEIIREEGVPVWDENTGEIHMKKVSLDDSGAQVEDKGDEMTVTLELPGLDKKTLQVSIQESKRLFITGEKKADRQKIERRIELPYPAQDKGQKAEYEDGVLTIRVRKAPVVTNEIPVPVR